MTQIALTAVTAGNLGPLEMMGFQESKDLFLFLKSGNMVKWCEKNNTFYILIGEQ